MTRRVLSWGQRLALIIGLTIVSLILLAGLMVLLPGGDNVMRRVLFGEAPQARFCQGGALEGSGIGGDFALIDQNGAPFTGDDLRGQPDLLYFGYTFCPDVCPTDVAILAETAAVMKARGTPVRPVFITLDPERDTQEALAEYAAAFSEDMAALTGDEAAVNAAARAYRVSFRRPEDRSDPYYTVDHSALFYFVDEEGEAAAFFPHNSDPAFMADALTCRLAG